VQEAHNSSDRFDTWSPRSREAFGLRTFQALQVALYGELGDPQVLEILRWVQKRRFADPTFSDGEAIKTGSVKRRIKSMGRPRRLLEVSQADAAAFL
jgi:hypothetical protein